MITLVVPEDFGWGPSMSVTEAIAFILYSSENMPKKYQVLGKVKGSFAKLKIKDGVMTKEVFANESTIFWPSINWVVAVIIHGREGTISSKEFKIENNNLDYFKKKQKKRPSQPSEVLI